MPLGVTVMIPSFDAPGEPAGCASMVPVLELFTKAKLTSGSVVHVFAVTEKFLMERSFELGFVLQFFLPKSPFEIVTSLVTRWPFVVSVGISPQTPTTDGVKTFFAPDAHVEARPDGPFPIYMNPYAEPGMKGGADIRVLAVQDPRINSYTWNAPPALPAARNQPPAVVVPSRPTREPAARERRHTGR